MNISSLKTKLLYFLLAGLIPATALSQEIDPTLEILIQKALEKNHGLNVNQLEGEQARVDQKQAKAVFLP